MRKEIPALREFSFFLKTDKQLSRVEKNQMHNLLVRTYPSFRNLFDKHGYYSTVKPQMNFLIKNDDILVGTGKFLWRKIEIKSGGIKLFAFGMVVANEYQNRGLGTALVKLCIKEAKERGGEILYASTSNLKVKRMLDKVKFQKLNVPIFYRDAITGRIKREKTSVYIFELTKGLTKRINTLSKIYIGVGPI